MIMFLAFTIPVLLIAAKILFVKADIYLSKKPFRILLGTHLLFLLLPFLHLSWPGTISIGEVIDLPVSLSLQPDLPGLLRYGYIKQTITAFFLIPLYVEFVCATILVTDVAESYKKELYYTDDKYRLENTDRFIMAHPSLPALFVKEGLFEKRYNIDTIRSPYRLSIDNIKKIVVKELTGSRLAITFMHTTDTLKGTSGSYTIEVQLDK